MRFFAWYFDEFSVSNDIHTPYLTTLIVKEAENLNLAC